MDKETNATYSPSEVFKKLNDINVNEHTEKKDGLAYLSWAWAWAEVKKKYPCATYVVRHYDGKPYLYDENLGYLVFTEMTIAGLTHEMWLPVLDVNNKTMKKEHYSYKVKEYKDKKWTGGFIDKSVEPASMFDVNKTIMRCLVKNIAVFGLGLYIYAREDLPEADSKIFCVDCNKEITSQVFNGKHYTAEEVAARTKAKYGRALCAECSKAMKESQKG